VIYQSPLYTPDYNHTQLFPHKQMGF